MAKLAIGGKVPDFTLESTAGPWRPKSAAGHALVLYFYPRDNTSGCTREGEAFRDRHAEFRRAKAVIIGVSTDSLASHLKFKAKYRFPFELLSDPEQKACAIFDVIKEKSMYGKRYVGVERSTFLIDAKGVLRAEWRKVKVDGHADEVLAAVRSL
ncbi:MAG TPA: peroxiredoxin [Candidatus Acidoferrales bacterium]|nr:peroxiredoxin [Candidatus Acidoferrales bacterium]